MDLFDYLLWMGQVIIQILLASPDMLVYRLQRPAEHVQGVDTSTPHLSPETSSPPPLPPDGASSDIQPGNDGHLPGALQRLQEDLKAYRVASSIERSHEFISRRNLQRLVDGSVHAVLADFDSIESGKVEAYADLISRQAAQLFAILVDIKKEQYIVDFLNEGIRDNDLPFLRTSRSSLSFITQQGTPIHTLKHWDSQSIGTLELKQYRVLSPIFQRHQHYELNELHILPFVSNDAELDTGPIASGGFGEVTRAYIHPDHHLFGDCSSRNELPVAVKRMFREVDFEPERKAYKALGELTHSNLINLLFTYRYRNKFHLVFPLADGTLLDYWKRNPCPEISPVLFGWALTQMTGIASALSLFHKFMNPDVGIPLFGRHGDIKAQNILIFPSSNNPGTLKIADLGLARVYGRDSKSNVVPDNVNASPTYSPPDAARGCRVSRKWDIWSLGCFYLEFVTYLLLGYAGIQEFSNRRLHEGISGCPEYQVDTFYSTCKEIVEPSVITWVNVLRRNARCSSMIHDFLDLIMDEMILIDPQKRSTSRAINQKLRKVLERSQSDENYLVGPDSVAGCADETMPGAFRPMDPEISPTPPLEAPLPTRKIRTWKF
ncbi:kinase-like domain-containing protein [Aspergillus granulosus]|uniref:Kinase-like domain-containing protein n=1 Tax=Aspergillus granulosus TaxID=176169 RepID=A0ABR4GU53_9EURO